MVAQRVGRYNVLESLGEGSLGVVYKAYDGDLARPVALRVLSDGIRWDATLRSRLQQECQSISNLQHPHIAELYELGEDGKNTFIAMELLQGADLRSLITGRSGMSVETKLLIIKEAAEALEHAHLHAILHRDIKPSNIFLTPQGAKIVDFGIAHLVSRCLVHPSVRWGAPIYLAPEQIRGKSYDARSEIFVAGIVFFELLTGTHPFHDGNSNKVLDNIVSGESLPSLDPFIEAPPGLGAILDKCLARDPSERFSRMAEVGSACGDLLEEMSRDSQSMLVELQMSLPRLKRAAAKAGAPEVLEKLSRDIQALLASDKKRDYMALDRLMSVLAEQNQTIHSLLKGRRPPSAPPQEAAPAASDSTHFFSIDTEEAAAIGTGDEPVPAPEEALAAASCCTGGEEAVEPMSPRSADKSPVQPAGASLGGLHRDEMDYLEKMFDRTSAEEDATAICLDSPSGSSGDFEPMDQSSTIEPADASGGYGPPDTRGARVISMKLWMAGLTSVVVIVAVAFWMNERFGLAVRAMSGIEQLRDNGAAAQALPASQPTVPALPRAKKAIAPSTSEMLLREAQTLARAGRVAESRVFIRRVLEIQPTNEQARQLLERLEADGAAPPPTQERALRTRLVAINSLIEEGELRKAKAEMDRLRELRPVPPELVRLRRLWNARDAELRRQQERSKAEQAEAARKLKAEESWLKRVNELIRQGQYPEAQSGIERWLAENPGSQHARTLQGHAGELLQCLRAFEATLSSGKYSEAAAALARLESMNPSDPSVPELRRKLNSRASSARASVSIHRLEEPGALMLDGATIGNGEVEGASVSIGEHTLSVKTGSGSILTLRQEFVEGQKLAFVYDSQMLRVSRDGDRELAAARKERERIHRFPVEHSHGIFRGSCKGELLFNGFEVEYRPQTGAHGFRMPSSGLRLRVSDRNVDFLFSSDQGQFQSFKLNTAGEAASIQQAWGRLVKLRR
jgi:serine/threonine protein kinase/tetratricopeptide (TPR) repeat protein